MATMKKAGRIYWRHQGSESNARAYADFRDFADVGGKQEALIPPGLGKATTDAVIAEALVAKRLSELQARRRDRVLFGAQWKQIQLGEFVIHHIKEKQRSDAISMGWIAESKKKLDAAAEFFGSDRDIATITVNDIYDWINWLRLRTGRYGHPTLSGGTLRHYLNALSNLFRRAAAEGYVAVGYNPIASMMDKPTARRSEAHWLEVTEAATILEAARSISRSKVSTNLYPLLAAFLLTGGRESEVLGLEIRDVSFERKTITFRPNAWRRLKTRTSHRTIPLWTQLEEILRDYLDCGLRPNQRLLFPSHPTKIEQPLTDFRKAIDTVVRASRLSICSVRTKAFRHTYCAARLQTLDNGHPVSLWTVARELGHGGTALVERVYGHLGKIRARGHEVHY